MWFSNPAIVPGLNPIQRNGPEQFDDIKAGPCVIYKEAPGIYHMWRESIDSTGSGPTGGDFYNAIAYCTSTDGRRWTKVGVLVTPQDYSSWENYEICPSALRWDAVNSLWVMTYHGGNNSGPRAIGRMTSPNLANGGTWTRYGSNPILNKGTTGQWDDALVYDGQPVRLSTGNIRMYFSGGSSINNVGVATSTDNGFTYTKYGSNPILAPGAGGAWDDYSIEACWVHYVSDTEIWMWYIGQQTNASGARGLGLALSVDTGLTFTKLVGNPRQTQAYQGDLSDSLDGIVDGGKLRLYYGTFNFIGETLRGLAYSEADEIQDPGSPPLLDDFNRASLGANWSNGSKDTATGGLVIDSSTAIAHPSGGSYRMGAYYNVRQYGPDCVLVAEILSAPTGDWEGFTFFIRTQLPVGSDVGVGFYISREDNPTNVDWNISTPTINTTIVVPEMIAAGQFIGMVAKGDWLQLWWRKATGPWILIHQVREGSMNKAGYISLDLTLDTTMKLTNLWAQTLEGYISSLPDPPRFGPF